MYGNEPTSCIPPPNALHRWPLLEHLGDGFLHHLLILIAVVVKGILSDSAPDQTLILPVIQIDDQCSDNILLRSGSPTHPS